VTATDYSKFATLSRRDFLRFLQWFPAIRESMLIVAAERRQMNRRSLEGMSTEEGAATSRPCNYARTNIGKVFPSSGGAPTWLTLGK
jgi:hypothetical protein